MENKSTNIKERILQIAKIKGVSYELFFEELGMSYGNFKGKAKNSPLNSDAIANILTKYDDINPDWLLLGLGDMKKDKSIQIAGNRNIANTGHVGGNMISNSKVNNDNSLEAEVVKLKGLLSEKDDEITRLNGELLKAKDEIIQLLRGQSVKTEQ